MSPETANAIAAVARVATKQLTGEDLPETVELELCNSRGPWWCGVEDDEEEVLNDARK